MQVTLASAAIYKVLKITTHPMRGTYIDERAEATCGHRHQSTLA